MHGVAIGDDKNCQTDKLLVQEPKFLEGLDFILRFSGFQGNDDLVCQIDTMP